MKSTLIIESQYLPPIATMFAIAESEAVIIDQFEFYEKKSYRNRCYICNADGLFRLTVPLEQGKSIATPMKDVRIAKTENWQMEHWKSIVSAYNRSPFFEFYKDELQEVFLQPVHHLINFNTALLQFLLLHFQIETPFRLSDKYIETNELSENHKHFRSAIRPQKNKATIEFIIPKYQQVFADRIPFQKQVSSLDLLFNQGPMANSYFEKMREFNKNFNS